MKIAFTGAGGTGKTTMAKYLAEKWGVPYVGSPARDVMRELGIESEVAQNTMTDADLLTLQFAIFKRITETRSQYPSYVTDRCVLDNYIYGLRRCGSAMWAEHRTMWEEAAIKDLYAHDLVFYAPVGLFNTEDDGTRETTLAHQYLMDAAIYGFLCKHAFDRMASHVYIMSMPDLERRQRYVDALASELHATRG